MWNQPYGKPDVESGARPLYPMMLESPELRWSFIRKIYTIVTIQMLLTIAVAAVVVTVHPISHFFAATGAGLALYIVLIITPFIGTILLLLIVFLKWVFDFVQSLNFYLFCICSFVPVVLLLPEAPCELLASWDLHCVACVFSGVDMCLH